ncbi:hypothetical protein PoB_007250800 [Plakobranchus ocellatus]|uniref:Uncharacterized protein n=1 Tax=Plakobranchus ocellatus TaxID=259542 RepID=A0AAV4DNY9_9GAST|nr:hypothetical protein PoB_007250800 [Plakobranchus ocellatus]
MSHGREIKIYHFPVDESATTVARTVLLLPSTRDEIGVLSTSDKIGVLSTSDKIGVFFLQPKSHRCVVRPACVVTRSELPITTHTHTPNIQLYSANIKT